MTLRSHLLLGTALVAIAAGTTALSPAAAAPADPTRYLLNQAEYWHEKGRNDLSIQALERILSFEQNQPDALYYLAIYSAQDGKVDAAKRWGQRFEKAAPVDPRINELNKALHLGSTGAWQIAEARRLASQGALSDAVRAYQQAFGNGLIPYDYASEYYLTLAGTKWGWDEAANGLAQMVANHPADHELALAFGKVLSYREKTRRQAINVLLGLDENSPAVHATLRQALIWLNAKADDAPLFQAYLRDHPDDSEIEARLAHAVSPVPGDPGGQARQKGYAKLNDGDAAAAQADFADALKANPNDADALAGAGLSALQEKDYASAEASLSRAIKLAPAKKSQWSKALETAKFYRSYSQAAAALQSGDLSVAEKLARDLAESGSPDADVAKNLLADILTRENNLQEAESLYREILRSHPHDSGAIAGLAHVLNSEGRVEEASALVSQAPQDAASNPSLRQTAANIAAAKADALAKGGDLSRAERAYEKSIADDPTNPWIRLSYARLLLKTGAERQAKGIMSPLAQAAQPSAEALYALAIFEDESGDDGRASEYLGRIPAADRTDEMGKLAFKLRSQGAIASARKSSDPAYASSKLEDIASDPQATPGLRSQIAETLYGINPPAAIALARKEEDRGVSGAPMDYAGFLKVLGDAGLDAEARTFLLQIERHAEDSGNKAQVTALRATLAAHEADHMRSDGSYADAYDLLAGALRDSPNDKELLLALGRLYDSGHMADKARSVFNHLQQTYPDDADVLSASIDNALASNDLKSAQRLIDRAQSLYPRDPRLYVALGRIAEARGQREGALKAYRAAQALRAEEVAGGAAGPNTPPTLQDKNPFRARSAQNQSASSYFVADAGPTAADDSSTASGVTGATAPQTDDRTQVAYAYVPAGRSAAPIFVPSTAIPVNAPGDALSDDIDRRIARLEQGTKPHVSVEVATRDRSGEAGLSQMTEIDGTASYQGTLFGKGQLTASLQPVILDAGTPTSSAAARFGTNPAVAIFATPPAPDGQQASGLAVSLKYKIGTLTADLGTTPLGFWRLSPVGGIEWAPEIADNTHVQIGVERRAVTDSVLSYNGARDPLTGQRWGAVMQTSAHGGISYDNGEGGAYFTARVGTLKGHNVASNSTIQGDAGAYLRPYQKGDAELQIGFNADFAHFKKNLRYFSWGQGGYFSPQSFVGLSLPLTYKDVQGRWSYSLQASPGLQYFHEDSSPYFPTEPAIQSLFDIAAALDPNIISNYASQTKTGFGFAGDAQVNYALTPSTSIGGGLKFNNFGDYNDTSANISFKHTLGK